MPAESAQEEAKREPGIRSLLALWLSAAWVLPPLALALWASPSTSGMRSLVIALAILAAPVPALVSMQRQRRSAHRSLLQAEETAAQLKLQLDTVRYRTSRLREELQVADKQARLSHQLTLLGQFTAGF